MRLIRPFRILLMTLVAALAVITPPAARADVPEQLQFTATTLDGKTLDGRSLAGKPAVLWFWTPWCPFCNQEGAFVGKVAAGHPNVRFVGVPAHSDPGAMNDFVNKYGLNFPQINDANGEIWGRFGVTWQPDFAFIRSNGDVDMFKWGDLISEDELNDRVANLN